MKDFDSLAEEMTPVIHSIIHRLHIYKNQDDFYQMGLIALWKASENFDSEKGNFMTYAYSYIRGTIMTELSKDTKKQHYEQLADDYYIDLIVDENCQNNDTYFDLFESIQKLTKKEQQFVRLYFFEGLKLSEIAKKFGVSYPTVKNWKREVLGKLRKELNRVE